MSCERFKMQDTLRKTDIKNINICSYYFQKDIKHNICWVRSSSGKAAIGFIVPCDLLEQCVKEGYLE